MRNKKLNFFSLYVLMTIFACAVLGGLFNIYILNDPDDFNFNGVIVEDDEETPNTYTSLNFYMTGFNDKEKRLQTLDEIIAVCEMLPYHRGFRDGVDTFRQVVFRYEDKQVERTCREFYEFLAGGKEL